ncbi:MAG: GIY-YIG nuclease family protein [Proteobacteria bacterium]|nr:GIY-YIG nuclease family protein [Pseudomonadota bacterium]
MTLGKSNNHPGQQYIGLTENLENRLTEHNTGKSIHTNKFKPWKLVIYVAFGDQAKAKNFEKYLKQGSGHAFAKRHLW